MMGTRAKTTAECDVFSRYARGIVTWGRHETKAIKARFWRLSRTKVRVETRREAEEA